MYRTILFAFFLSFGVLSAASPAPAPAPKKSSEAPAASLYYHPSCTHCHHVMEYLNKINKKVTLKNTSQPQYRSELQQLGQKGVPVLVVGSQVITGSDEIINYLKQHPEVLR